MCCVALHAGNYSNLFWSLISSSCRSKHHPSFLFCFVNRLVQWSTIKIIDLLRSPSFHSATADTICTFFYAHVWSWTIKMHLIWSHPHQFTLQQPILVPNSYSATANTMFNIFFMHMWASRERGERERQRERERERERVQMKLQWFDFQPFGMCILVACNS